MRPGPEAWRQSQVEDPETRRSASEHSGGRPALLSEEQRRLIDLLKTTRHGMTARQLQTRLSQSGSGVQQILEDLLERQLVARLNTLIPSYIYRYGGVDLDAD